MLLPVCESQKLRRRHEGGVRQTMLEERTAHGTWIPTARELSEDGGSQSGFYLKKNSMLIRYFLTEKAPLAIYGTSNARPSTRQPIPMVPSRQNFEWTSVRGYCWCGGYGGGLGCGSSDGNGLCC